MRFPGIWSRTKVKEQDIAKLLRHSLKCLIARAQIPNGVEDFLNTYAQTLSDVDQRQRNVQYENIHIAGANAPNIPPKQARRAQPTPAPPPPPPTPPCSSPPPPKCLCLHLLMISIMWRVPVMGVKRFIVTRPWRCLMKMWKWDRVHVVGPKLPVLFVVMAQSWTKFRELSHFVISLYYLLSWSKLDYISSRPAFVVNLPVCSTVPLLLHSY